MKSFSTVLKNSKAAVINEQKEIINTEKIAICNVLKEEYMIEGQLNDLPNRDKKKLATKLLEYWNPKSGINAAGRKLLESRTISLSVNSTTDDIKKYIINETKKDFRNIVNAFKQDNSKVVVEHFKSEIEPKTKKIISESAVRNIVWSIIGDKIKSGI